MDDKVFFRRNPDYIYREIAGEAVLVPTGKAAESFFGIISINSTSVFLWKALEKGHSLEELSEMFAQEYDLEEEQSLQDVTEFLDAALAHNMIFQC
ncbi:MAG: PqqD family protein [Blautia sp.]|uniref:PqqD family protein n=1 Tax=Blautia sp. TaxID=1955243 RepID=UPI0025BDACD8|nr:PqqD family protein [Blautia sp.]MCI7449872.1 PqqD family protein [Blautia sp.]